MKAREREHTAYAALNVLDTWPLVHEADVMEEEGKGLARDHRRIDRISVSAELVSAVYKFWLVCIQFLTTLTTHEIRAQVGHASNMDRLCQHKHEIQQTASDPQWPIIPEGRPQTDNPKCCQFFGVRERPSWRLQVSSISAHVFIFYTLCKKIRTDQRYPKST